MWLWPSWTSNTEVAAPPNDPPPLLTATDIMELARHLDWEEWALFLQMARLRNIDRMTRAEVEALFAEFKRGTVSPAGDPCTPRQLVELLYILSPPRWAIFQEFISTVELNAINFQELITKFCEYENSRTRNE